MHMHTDVHDIVHLFTVVHMHGHNESNSVQVNSYFVHVDSSVVSTHL